MNYILIGHNFVNEIQTISQVFFQNEKFKSVERVTDSGITLISVLSTTNCKSFFYQNGEELSRDITIVDSEDLREIKRLLKLSMFNLLKQITRQETPWGILTGIRPTKIANELLDMGRSDAEIETYLHNKFLVAPEKIRLIISIAKKERLITGSNTGDDYSLYLGIPFCPSRCRYCSFTSYPIDKYEPRLEQYISSVTRELELVQAYFKNRRLENIYIGGGTPAALPDRLLDRLLGTLTRILVKPQMEFTVEAGRPDVITAEKLEIMKKHKVTRISINPQTMNNDTLERIGRAHTAAQFVEKFMLARAAGFNNINTDLILGLPGEGLDDVRNTLEQIAELQPENITVHTLAIKRSSALKEELIENKRNENALIKRDIDKGELEKGSLVKGSLIKGSLIRGMLDLSAEYMRNMGMEPYYMYRQKKYGR